MKFNLKKIAAMLLIIILMLGTCVSGEAESLMPEHGETQTNRSLTIDRSHASDGYIIVKATESNSKLKIAISFNGESKIHYTLNTKGEEEILPLQYGDGRYTVALFRQISGTRYQKDGEISFSVKMTDKRGYMLYPNQWVNYTNETAAVAYATELCAGMTDEYEIVMTIYKFINQHFGYDWFKSRDVKSGVLTEILPDIDGTWESRSGICQDLAAVMCAMLRSQGIHTRLVVGTCGSAPHAWITIYYHNAEGKFVQLSLDPTYHCRVTANASYKAERYY